MVNIYICEQIWYFTWSYDTIYCGVSLYIAAHTINCGEQQQTSINNYPYSVQNDGRQSQNVSYNVT